MPKVKVKAARRGKRPTSWPPAVAEALEAEKNPPPVEPKLCAECGKRPAKHGDSCYACYMRAYRKRRPKELLPDGTLNPAALPPSSRGEDGPLTQEQLYEAMGDLPTLSQTEADNAVIHAAAESGMVATEAPEKPSLGYQRLWVYLRKFDPYFRRRIIARMQALGMDKLSILAAFLSEPKLRARWIDPLRDPRSALERDFDILAKEKPQGKKRPSDALRAYIERLLLLERMSLDLAANEEVTVSIRREMIQLAVKLGRDIALLEEAIKIVPTQGDVPTRRAQSGATKPSEDEEGEEEPEEEIGSGEYELPDIETGRR